jgi:hypothetical protein
MRGVERSKDVTPCDIEGKDMEEEGDETIEKLGAELYDV